MDPVFPLEVVSIILGYCGREELLNSRLVCKDWNDLCLSKLGKSSYTFKLPYLKIVDFVDFSTETGFEPILPGLELTTPDDMPSVSEIVSLLKSLLDVIGSTCHIVVLEVGQVQNPCWVKILPLLEKISSELRSMRLPESFVTQDNLPEMQEKAAVMTFPKLRTLKLPKTQYNYMYEVYSDLVNESTVLQIEQEPKVVEDRFTSSGRWRWARRFHLFQRRRRRRHVKF